MPYITAEDRTKFMWIEEQLEMIGPDMSAGDLQYLIALTIKHIDPYNYQTMNDLSLIHI